MADQERKASLAFGVDSSGVKPGLDDIKSQVRDMATDVQQSGQRAAKGINAIGDGAPAAAQKVETGARSLIGSIQRTTAAMEAGEKGTAKYYETLAKQRGVSAESLKPYLDDLRKAEAAQKLASGSLGSMEMSAKATAAALRGVPAQFTDIMVSLQGGQAPLTVFLQQGGQLKDMFGGAGAAAKALGGYVLGLVNPFTVAAAAAGVLALAYNQGSKEADGYRMAIITTGNAAGTTAGQMKAYAQSISGIVGTQGQAADAISELVATGKVAGDVLRDAGLAAVQYERATGQAVGKTADQFASLRNEPLSAVLKLNDGMNFLTESTYRQIKSLDEQGKTAEAARVAQEAYAQALTSRSGEIERNLGSIERGWLAIKDGAKGAWDAMLNIGRAETTIDKLKQVRLEIGTLEEQMRTGAGYAETAGGAALGSGRGRMNAQAQAAIKDRLARLGAEAAALEGVAYAEKTAAEEAAMRAEQMRGRAQWDKDGLKYLSEQEKLTRALTEAENEGRRLGASDAEIKQRQADIRAEFAKKATSANQSEIAGIRAKIVAEQEYIDRLRERGVAAEKVTEGERLTAKIQEELKGKLDAKTRTLKEQELVEAQRLATLNKVRASEEQRVKSIADSEAAYRKFLDSIVKAGDAIGEQAAKQEAANTAFGKGKTAIEEMVLAQQKLALANERDSGPWDPARISAMEVAISQQERYVRALQAGDIKVVNQHTDELLANAREQAKLYEDEARLIGLSALERAKVVALRQVELKYAKELARIKEMPEGTAAQIAAKEEQRLKVLEAKQIESQAAVSKVVEDDWNKTSQLIGDTLADYIMGGGKDAAQYLKRLFATLVLQPVVQMGVGGLMGMTGLTAVNAAAGGTSILSALSGAASINSLVSGGGLLGSAASTVGGWLGLGSAAGLGLTAGAGTGLSLASAGSGLGLGLGAGGLGLTANSIGASSIGAGLGTSAAAGGAGSAGLLASIPGWGWALAGVALLGGLASKFDTSGTPHVGAGAIYSAEGGLQQGASIYDQAHFRMGARGEWTAGTQAGVSAIAQGVATALDGVAKTFGKTAGYEVATAFADDSSKDGAWGSLRVSLGGLGVVDWNDTRTSRWAPREYANGEEGYKQYLAEIAKDTRTILLDMDLPEWADTIIDAVGDAADMDALSAAVTQIGAIKTVFEDLGDTLVGFSNLSGETETALLKAAGSLDALVNSSSAYYQGYYTEAERMDALRGQLTAAMDDLDLSIDPSLGADAKVAFRSAVEAAMGAGNVELANSLLALSGSFATAADYFETAWSGVVDSLLSGIQRIRGGTDEALDPAARYTSSKATFAWLSQSAMAGDAAAAEQLAGAAQAFLSASEAGGVSYAEYLRDRVLAEAMLASVVAATQASGSVKTARLPSSDGGASRDTAQQIYPGDSIVPRAYTPVVESATGAGDIAALLQELRALRAEVAALRGAAEGTARNTEGVPQLVRQIDNVTEGGNQMRAEVMNVAALAEAMP